MKIILSILFVLSSLPAMADCIQKLMSQPNCVDRLNATSFCQMMGNTDKAGEMVEKCLKGMSGSQKQKIALCLGGFRSSSKSKDKETLCDQKNSAAPSAVNQDSGVKEVEEGHQGYSQESASVKK